MKKDCKNQILDKEDLTICKYLKGVETKTEKNYLACFSVGILLQQE